MSKIYSVQSVKVVLRIHKADSSIYIKNLTIKMLTVKRCEFRRTLAKREEKEKEGEI